MKRSSFKESYYITIYAQCKNSFVVGNVNYFGIIFFPCYNFFMFPAEAEKIRLKILSKMSGEERMKASFRLNNLLQKVMLNGIKNQFPDISIQDLKKQIGRRTKSD